MMTLGRFVIPWTAFGNLALSLVSGWYGWQASTPRGAFLLALLSAGWFTNAVGQVDSANYYRLAKR